MNSHDKALYVGLSTGGLAQLLWFHQVPTVVMILCYAIVLLIGLFKQADEE